MTDLAVWHGKFRGRRLLETREAGGLVVKARDDDKPRLSIRGDADDSNRAARSARVLKKVGMQRDTKG